ncbi:MAG: SpoIIE family protein phosphatase [Prevotella sp.]|jgi:sigma-B regulation protein RsbU (phosphoserine phosphatase)|nr:SpoIIE family protein phosphatase [Prevotella sp.]
MSKKPKRSSFAKRLTRWIALTQLVVMGLAGYGIYVIVKSFGEMEETDLYKSYLSTSNANVSRILSTVYVGTLSHVAEIENNLDRPDKFPAIMKDVVAHNPYIRSCGISFVGDYYPQKGHWYCPYAIKVDSGRVVENRFIGDEKHDYLKAEWFTEALKADSSYWSKPFFDAMDSITPLVSCMIPIHDKQGKAVAIIGADLSLDWFSGKAVKGLTVNGENIKVFTGNDVDVNSSDDNVINWADRKWRQLTLTFIINKDGTYIAHPENERVIKENFFKLAGETPDSIDDQIGHKMVARKKGFYSKNGLQPAPTKFFDMDNISAYVFYEPVDHTDWSIALAVPSFMIYIISIGTGVILLLLIALALLVTRIVGRIVVKRATRPLNQLADSANEVAKGNFSAPLPKIKHNDEIRLLRDSFEGMQHSLSEYVEELKDTTASKAAIENELKVAHDIQMSMLPKTFPPYPERDDIDIYGTLTPAKDVGGDLFDFYIRDDKLFFCIGDVSGKGVPASLVMAMTRSLFRNISAHTAEPHRIAYTLNQALADGNENSMFVTAFIGVLELGTGLLRYCNAGHNPPLLIGREVSLVPCQPNVPLGLMADLDFVPQEIQFEHQMTIFLFTDGLNEAEDDMQVQFGDDRILHQAEALLANGKNQPAEIVNQMAEAVHAFVDGAQQSDDLTMLAIKYN